MGYDKDGHLRSLCSRHLAAHPNDQDRLEQRVRYTALDADGQPLSYRRYYGGTTSPACSSTLPFTLDFADYTYDARHQLRITEGKTYAYDSSGNRVSTRSGAALLDSLASVAASNRVGWRYSESGNPPQVVLERTLHHDGNGSRTRDLTGGGQGGDGSKLYYYNALGQQWAVKSYIYNGGSFQWVGPLGCRYDALGRQTRGCALGSAGGRAVFDGDNVVLMGASSWRVVHAPGVDDPLVGLYYLAPQKYFYLTDGQGRSLAFTDSAGNDNLGHVTYTQNGGNRAGAIDRSHTFANSRAETAEAPGLSFYRNRYYDQTTGRWTQEDPIGIAGGVNLYGFVGNNPVAYTDPFGLCPQNVGGDGKTTVYSDCPPGTEGYRTYLASMGTVNGSRERTQATQHPPPDLGGIGARAEAKCRNAAAYFVFSAVADATGLTALRAGLKAAKLAGLALRYAELRSLDGARRAAAAAGYAALNNRLNSSVAYGAVAEGYIHQQGASGVYAIFEAADFHWYDVIPVVGSVSAFLAAKDACLNPTGH